jgi:hypothetical protein
MACVIPSNYDESLMCEISTFLRGIHDSETIGELIPMPLKSDSMARQADIPICSADEFSASGAVNGSLISLSVITTGQQFNKL